MGIAVRGTSFSGRVTAVWLMTDDWKGAHRVSDVRDGITEDPLGHFVRNRMSTFNRIVRWDGHRGVLLRSGSHEK